MMEFSQDKLMLLHRLMLEETGGGDGVRDAALLDSVLTSAYATFDGKELYHTKIDKAARLSYALISNHAFVDGNKRIGMYVMLTFLELHGVQMTCTNDDVLQAGLGVADGSMKYEDLLAWVRRFCIYY